MYDALFVSDVHLHETFPQRHALFCAFLEQKATQCACLYILGDFFDYYFGDDDPCPYQKSVADALKKLSDKGVKIKIMRGNHDFLLADGFMQQAGAVRIDDPTIIKHKDQKILLSHGDAWCTKDISYQRLRKIIHNRFLQWCFLRLKVSWRKYLITNIDKKNKSHYKSISPECFDVVDQSAIEALEKYQCDTTIHGHTHRCGVHIYGKKMRYVMGNWHKNGSYLSLNKDGLNIHRFDQD